jgi:hypothetical protein
MRRPSLLAITVSKTTPLKMPYQHHQGRVRRLKSRSPKYLFSRPGKASIDPLIAKRT